VRLSHLPKSVIAKVERAAFESRPHAAVFEKLCEPLLLERSAFIDVILAVDIEILQPMRCGPDPKPPSTPLLRSSQIISRANGPPFCPST